MFKVHGEFSVAEVIRRFDGLAKTKTNNSEEEFGSMGVEGAVASVAEITLEEKSAAE
jgi:hypothetical protein